MDSTNSVFFRSLLFIFEVWMLIRILPDLSSPYLNSTQNLHRNRRHFQLGIICLIASAATALLIPQQIFFLIQILNLLILASLPPLFKRWLRTHAAEKTVVFVDSLILFLKSGNSLRESVRSIAKNSIEDPATRFFAQKIYRQIYIEPLLKPNIAPKVQWSPDLLWECVSAEIESLEISKHSHLKRLASLKRSLVLVLKLESKTKLALRNSHAQAIVMTILFLGLFVFTLWTQSGSMIQSLVVPISFSCALFFMGLLLLLKIGRSFKWNL